MKFTVLYQCCGDVKDFYERKKKEGYWPGVKVIALDKIKAVKNGDLLNGFSDVYAFRCKGFSISYLIHKIKYGKYATHHIGW